MLDWLGTEEDELNMRLYAEALIFVSSGLLCGELYRATMSKPKEKMSAAEEALLSMTKSGDVKSKLIWTDLGNRAS